MRQDLKNIIGKHIVYNYAGLGRYEIYYQSEDRVVYSIHGGPMKGRSNYNKAYYQQITENTFMISWVEETGTVATMVTDFERKKVKSFIGFSQGHWEFNEDAHGDKRNPKDFERWRKLYEVGKPSTMHVHLDDADIIEIFEGPGELQPVTEDMPCF